MKRLILTADDFGPIAEINQGIYKAIENGKINSVAVLVNFDNAKATIETAKKIFEKHKVEVGLHFTMTSGNPISKKGVEGLINNKGEFYDFHDIRLDLILGKEVRVELEAQYNRFVELFGFVPKHISNHHGLLDVFPDLYIAYLDFCTSKNLAKRSARIQPGFNKALYFEHLRNKLNNELPGLYKFIGSQKDEDVIDYYREKYKWIKSPHRLDTRFFKIRNEFSIQNAFKDIEENQTHEMMFHLIDPTIDTDKVKVSYKGVTKDYFKGRQKEMRQLSNSKFPKFIENNLGHYGFGSWDKL